MGTVTRFGFALNVKSLTMVVLWSAVMNATTGTIGYVSCEESAIFFSNLADTSHIRQNHVAFIHRGRISMSVTILKNKLFSTRNIFEYPIFSIIYPLFLYVKSNLCMYYQDLWDLSARENKYFALFATHYFTNSRYVLEFQWNLLTTRIGFVQTVSYENQSLLLILVQNRQENRVDIQKCVRLMFLNYYSHMQEYMVL